MSMGVVTGVATAPLSAGAVIWTVTTTLAAQLPDIDHPNSRLGRALGPLAKVISKLCGGHRGLTHSLIGLLIFYYLADLFTPLPIAVTLGAATHLLGDLMTERGIPIFWPIKKRFRIASFNTNSKVEKRLIFPLTILAGLAVAVYRVSSL